MNVIKGVSPIAWQHVNLLGTFEFNQAASEVDIDALGLAIMIRFAGAKRCRKKRKTCPSPKPRNN